MIECIFTIDYEIYGNGTGSLMDLVHDPAKRLQAIFDKWNARFVNFVEVAEFEKIEAFGTDPAIGMVKQQIRDLHENGFEIGLHLHPQWCNARYEQGRWVLDATEYNLCTLPRNRIAKIVDQSLGYLRHVLDQPDFSPLSFRAGNWLFQPTSTAASVLSEHGIKVDSSVFKGGVQRNHKLDYRPALKNGYYWPFGDNANRPDGNGAWIEVPIYTEMVPSWRMTTSKRMSFGGNVGMAGQGLKRKVNRALDFLRLRYPRKFDFCRMTLDEMTAMIDRVMHEDRKSPEVYRPLVAIGHTKDLNDFQAVDAFLAFLRAKDIGVRTFSDIYSKLAQCKTGLNVPAGSEAKVSREYAASAKL
jgi:hypothetical protein